MKIHVYTCTVLFSRPVRNITLNKPGFFFFQGFFYLFNIRPPSVESFAERPPLVEYLIQVNISPGVSKENLIELTTGGCI